MASEQQSYRWIYERYGPIWLDEREKNRRSCRTWYAKNRDERNAKRREKRRVAREALEALRRQSGQ